MTHDEIKIKLSTIDEWARISALANATKKASTSEWYDKRIDEIKDELLAEFNRLSEIVLRYDDEEQP